MSSQTAATPAADPWTECPPSDPPAAQRACAVDAARSGDTIAALDRLEALLAAHPDDRDVRLDLAVISQWAGNDRRTVDLLAPLPTASVPDYALESHARAARNLQHWDLALSSFERLAQRHPDRLDLHLAHAMTLADAGRFAEAEGLLQVLAPEQTGSASLDLHLACGYVNERARRLTAALACYQKALDADPQHGEARRQHVLVAAALGAAAPAMRAARAHAALFSAEEMLRLELDAAAAEVRWSSLPDGDVAGAGGARSRAQQALAAHDRLAAALQDHSTPLARTLSFDRIVALVADMRMAEAASEFEQLEAERLPAAELPVYVLAAAGEAYLYLQRPKRAAALYEAALQQPEVLTPQQRFDLRVGLFYAYSDQGAFAAAATVAEELLADEQPWINPAPGRFLPSARYAQGREIVALLLAYRERHQAALAALDEMLAIAPANAGLRLSRADVLRWRGWPAQAAQELVRVQRQEPDNLRADTLAAQLALDTRRYPEAHRAMERVAARAPDSRATLNLLQRWTLHNRPELSVTAQAGRSDGNAFSSDDWQIEGYYFTAPLRYRYRAFVHDINRYGKFDEGVGRDHRLGAGVEYRAPRWAARGEVHQGLEQNTHT
ncbi:MAG: poly-beta-1,6 N-acetyl-D-glucosamine export porin PgaA, partial [Pseudomonadales bacterium]